MGVAASRHLADYQFEFRTVVSRAGRLGAELRHANKPVASPLFDTPEMNVGYRFLDVFHLAHAVVLGWSPNTSRFLSGIESPLIDPPQDDRGIEDAISVLTFTYASLKDSDVSLMDIVDPELVTHIQSLTRDRIDPVAAEEWDRAAQEGIAAWQRLLLGDSLVYLDFNQRRLQVSHH